MLLNAGRVLSNVGGTQARPFEKTLKFRSRARVAGEQRRSTVIPAIFHEPGFNFHGSLRRYKFFVGMH